MYELIIDTETTVMFHLHMNPFDLGDLPILDFVVYRTKLINMIDELGV